MIKINLIKTQVPTEIDLPKRKRNPKFIVKLLLAILAIVVLLIVGIYFVFIKGSEKIVVKEPKVHIVHKRLTKEIVKAKKKVEFVKKSTESLKEKKNIIVKEKKTQTLLKKRAIAENKKLQEQKKRLENKKIMERLKKMPAAVFSLNIKLSKIPKPIKKQTTQNSLYNEIVADNFGFDNTSKKTNVTKQNGEALFSVKVRTKSPLLLKKYLKKMKIKYKIKKEVYRILKTYDIFVGGFDSYPKLAKFAVDLKSKGYSIYKITNINLLFYICIDESVNEKMKEKYIAVWSKTPFKIITKEHKKTRYIYIFNFKCSKKQFNLLKKRGFYPIILSKVKSGA